MVFEGLTPAEVAAASSPALTIGHGVLDDALSSLGRFAVYTMPEPWALVAEQTRDRASAVTLIANMERTTLERLVDECPDVDTLVGIGGGASVDTAKYIGWRTGRTVVTAPTVVSVDAAVTNTIAVREQGRVNYVGFVVPRLVLVDLNLVQQAPERLNRAGIGDILSIHTGSFDWALAEQAGRATTDPAIVARAARLVAQLHAGAAQFREVTDTPSRRSSGPTSRTTRSVSPRVRHNPKRAPSTSGPITSRPSRVGRSCTANSSHSASW